MHIHVCVRHYNSSYDIEMILLLCVKFPIQLKQALKLKDEFPVFSLQFIPVVLFQRINRTPAHLRHQLIVIVELPPIQHILRPKYVS